MQPRILVIEDEPDMAMGVKDNLEFEGYEVLLADAGELGVEIALRDQPQCILLDVMLPGIDGFEVCRRLRRRGFRAPILMLTARGQEIDKVRGLELGADDYVTKPFGLSELVARIRAALRRYKEGREDHRIDEMRLGNTRVSLQTGRVRRGKKESTLGYYETEILRMLHARSGEVVERRDLLKEIWGLENEPMNRSVDNHIVSLRRKVEKDPGDPHHILTVHGLGYKLVP